MKGNVQTGLRVSETMDNEISRVATECDLSRNAAMKMLIGLGLRVYAGAIVPLESCHSPARTPESCA